MAASRQVVQNNHQRQFWTDFFLLYESLPALWDMRSALYKDKHAKLEAYDLMVEKLRQLEPHADRESVLRKINIFRTNYRRECSRINVSHMLGKQYKTTLWYYDLLNFLQSQETRRAKKISYNSSGDGGEKSILRKRRNTDLNARQCKITKHSQPVELPQIIQEECYDYDEDTHYDYDIENKDVIIEDILGDDEVSQQQQEAEEDQQHYQNEFQSFSFQRIMNQKTENTECSNGEFMGETEVFAELVNEQQEPSVSIQQEETLQESETAFQPPPQEQEQNEWCVTAEHPIQMQQQIPKIQHFLSPKKMLKHVQTMTTNFQNCTPPPQQLPTTSQRSDSGRISEASEILAKSWAIQYDEMSSSQRIYARRAIADILFEGCMGNLGRDNRGGATMSNRMHQVSQQQAEEEEEEVESSYVYEDGSEVKFHDWIVKMK